MNFFFLAVFCVFSVIMIKLLMLAGKSSIPENEPYCEIVPVLAELRSFMDSFAGKWIIVIAVNALCSFVLNSYYKVPLIDAVNILLVLDVFWACSAYDIRYEIIPNSIVLIAIGIAIVMLGINVLIDPPDALYYLVDSLVAGIALLVTAIICRLLGKDSVGMGDVKLLGAAGLMLGVDSAFYTVLSSIIILFIIAVILLLTKKADRNTSIPFAPFLLAGLVFAVIGYGVC